jgi:beta-mannanase
MTVLATLLGGTGSAFVAPVAAHAVTGADLKLPAVDDTYATTGRPTTNFGQDTKLRAGRLNGDAKTPYLKFVVPAGTTVTGSQLNLTTIGGIFGDITISRVLDTGWTEDTLTQVNAPAIGLPLATASVNGVTLSFDLGGEIAGPGTYAFAIQSSSPTAVTRIRSAEDNWGRPEMLVHTATPATVPTDTDASPPVVAPTDSPTASPVPIDSPAPVADPATDPTAPTADPTAAPTTAPTTVPTPPSAEPTTPATDPATTVPATTAPTTTAPTTTAPAPGECVTDAMLVPSCGVLWGAAAGGFTKAPRDEANKDWEQLSGRTATIFHTYHKGDEVFPTKSEIAMTEDPAHPRVLLLNWKVAYGANWAKVAAGQQDRRIDTFATRAKAYGKKFFLVLNHEPENDVVARTGSGWEAKDFAAMYRHTVLRLRADGVTTMINVVAYMGNEKWMAQSWWNDLYPGDDVVDWIGLDSYVSAEKNYYHYGMFADLLDRKAPNGPAFYDWAVANHRSKPMMIAEWGAYNRIGHGVDKSDQFTSVLPELAKRPQIKAIVYFDTKKDNSGDRDISIDNLPSSLTSFKKLAASPLFDVKIAI